MNLVMVHDTLCCQKSLVFQFHFCISDAFCQVMAAVKHSRKVMWCFLAAIVWMIMLLTVAAEDGKPNVDQPWFEF
jgi:hypothetical protein